MKLSLLLAILSLSILFFSCEDVVPITIEEGTSQLSVDGMITNLGYPDTVVLTRTVAYLNNNEEIPTVKNAIVVITTDNGNIVDTLNNLGNGKYVTTKIQGEVGKKYELFIDYEGEKFYSITEIKRVPPIDSIVTDFRQEGKYGREPGYFIDFFAKDLPGLGDTYRLKVYRNGVLFNRPSDLIISFDGSFSSDAPTDGFRFVFPIRESLNPRPNEGDAAPYVPGDVVKVEILSLTEDHYGFLREIRTQLNNGGLFASPPANLSTNIMNLNPNSEKKAVGWFGGSAISSSTITISEQ